MTESIGDFDHVADSYADQLKTALGVFGGESDYFAHYKVELVSRTLKESSIKTILDYGSGIGSSIPYFKEFFPVAEISATDLSTESLKRLKAQHPDVNVIQPNDLASHRFDLVFVSCVIHHMPVDSRSEEIDKLLNLVQSGGNIFVFEHNPFNPVTRRIVSKCEFDEGVVLVSKRHLRQLFASAQPSFDFQSSYCMFFPPVLKRFTFLDRFIGWLPLGGQHFLFGHRSKFTGTGS